MPRVIFVYGTLLRGEANHHLIAPFVRAVEPAVALHTQLHLVTARYPGMVVGSGQVAGELVTIQPGRWLDVLAELDDLEDYFGPGHPANDYRRLYLPVTTSRGSRLAVTYLWDRPVAGLPLIPGGDWRRYRAEGTSAR